MDGKYSRNHTVSHRNSNNMLQHYTSISIHSPDLNRWSSSETIKLNHIFCHRGDTKGNETLRCLKHLKYLCTLRGKLKKYAFLLLEFHCYLAEDGDVFRRKDYHPWMAMPGLPSIRVQVNDVKEEIFNAGKCQRDVVA